MIRVEDVTKRFGSKHVLKGVSYTTKGNVIGLLGPNGSGKTTLLRILAGVMKQTSGSVVIKSSSGDMKRPEKSQIGYLPQNFGLIKSYTVYEHMQYFACMKNLPKCDWEKSIQDVLTSGNLVEMSDVKCGKLSGGMVRRVGIAQALLGTPDVVLLDEPTVGLDPEERIRFQNAINQYRGKCTIVVSTHILDDVENICDELIVLNQGQMLYCGDPVTLAMKAHGKVFTMTKRESMHWQEYGINMKSYYENDAEYVRFLYLRDGEYENSKACSVYAGVEDGYMYLIKSMAEYDDEK